MNKRVINRALIACTTAIVLLATAAHAQQRDIMLVLDNSGSMRRNDPDFLTPVAVKTFIRNLDGDTLLGILIFDEDVDVAVPLSPLNVDTRARFLDSLTGITYRGQWTHSSAALERALYELRNNGRALAEKSIVFMTDGIVDTGDAARDVERTRWIQTELAASAANSGVRVFGIAFTDNADFQLIQSLAHRSGGEYYRAYQATDIERVFQSIDNALLGPGEAAIATLPPPTLAPLPSAEAPPPAPTLPQATQGEPAPGPEPPALPQLAAVPSPSPLAPEPLPGVAPELPPLAALEPTLPSSDTDPASGATDSAASFLAEMSEPEPEPASAATDDHSAGIGDGVETPAPEAPADALPAAGMTAQRASESGLPSTWLIAAGGILALVLGAGVFLFVRKREKPAPASQVPKAFLNDLGGATGKSSHELGAVPTVIGRLSGHDADGHHYVVIDEGTIGRRHAIVDYTEHAYWVADQNSLNGTFVNGKRIRERTRLKHGDRIRFHSKEFEFVLWEMFETDRTEMSHTMFTDMLDDVDDDATQMRSKPRDRDSSSTTTDS